MKVVEQHDMIQLPDTFRCPICDAALSPVEVNEWTQRKDGTWVAVGISFDCVTEPDIDSDDWWDWFHGHWPTPYIDWMPLEHRILEWLQKHYRFNVTD